MGSKEKFDYSENSLVEEKNSRSLVLHNDDVHTFDYVIEALVDVCEHDLVQAEQCTFLVHYKGKCAVKEGSMGNLRPLKNKLINLELNATID